MMGPPEKHNGLSSNDQWPQWRVYKNLIVLSLGFFLLFTSYLSSQNLQTSLNSQDNLGVICLSTIYAALIVGCLFLPNTIIKLLGFKKTMACSMFLYSFYFFANFYPSFYTMIPTSILVGLGASTLWPAKCSYVSQISQVHSDNTNTPHDLVLSNFFGIFFGFFQCSQISGNIISYMVLKPSSSESNSSSEDSFCGVNFCNDWSSSNSSFEEQPTRSTVQLLFGVYAGVSLSAVLLLFTLLDEARDPQEETEPTTKLLLKAAQHLRNKKQLLMIPITIYSGLEQAYIWGDFTKAFVTCTWGVHNVGYVMICFGVCNAVTCFSLSPVVKFLGRPAAIAAASVIDAACIFAMLWTERPTLTNLFVLAGLWGVADAVWQSQINTHYGVLFPEAKKEGFAHYRLWESLGFILAFSYSPHLCIRVQLYLLLVVLAIGIVCYFPTGTPLACRKKSLS